MATNESATADPFAEVFARDNRDSGAESAAPSAPEQPRDPDGKFAAREPQQTPQPPAESQATASPETPLQQQEQASRHVPLSELLSEREKRKQEVQRREEAERRAIEHEATLKAYQRMLEQQSRTQTQQPIPEPPDFFTDPDAAINHRMQQVQQTFENRMLNLSEAAARRAYGSQVVDEALNAARSAGINRQFVGAPDPYGELVAWHKRAKALSVIGDDPDAYRTKLEAEVRAKVLAELKQGGGQPAATRFPGSLADATAQGSQGAHYDPQAMADQLFSTGRNRRLG